MAERFKRLLDVAAAGKSLGRDGAREAMEHLVSGEQGDARISEFLRAVDPAQVGAAELAGFAEAMRAAAVVVQVDRRPVIDTCGTGGDGLQTFNFSTAAALVAAGAGVAVAKHGNRAVSSRSGSADVLEALGVAVDDEPEAARRSIEEDGFGFLFAPRFHPAMSKVAAARKALGVRTIFNLLGPLMNPALVKRQVVGLFEKSLLERYAETLLLLGAERVLIVHGDDGMDELSLAGMTTLCHGDARSGVRVEKVAPEQAGLGRADPKALLGTDASGNALLMERLLEGEDGPLLDGTLYNAAAALLVAGTVSSLKEGAAAARESVRSGKARAVLANLRRRRKNR